MRAVMLAVPEDLVDERRRLGIDVFDEQWEGILHIVPPPSFLHQTLEIELATFLKPRVALRGIQVRAEMGVFRPGSAGRDYRVPDLVLFRAGDSAITERGIEGAPLCVIEIRSPDDETSEKLPFYEALGVREVLIVEPKTRAVELFRLSGRRLLPTSADGEGRLHAATIDARFSRVDGESPTLRVECGGETLEV